MRRILHNFLVWAIIFSAITLQAYSQNLAAFFKPVIPAAVPQAAFPSPINLEGLINAPDCFIAPVKVTDGKKHLIAAHIEKKERWFLHSHVNNKEQAENGWQQYADPAASVITVSKK